MVVTDAVVIGSGFAGIQAVKSILARSPRMTVTLVSRTPYATMLPALPDVLSGRVRKDVLATPLADIFRKDLAGFDSRSSGTGSSGSESSESAGDSDHGRVHLLIGNVSGIELERRILTVDDGKLAYRSLVIAHGSTPNFFGFTPQGGTLYTVDTLDHARELRREFTRRERSASSGGGPVQVVVVGAGYTGLEICMSLKHGARSAGLPEPEITVVEAADRMLPFLSDREREYVARYLEQAGVTILLDTALTSYDGMTATLSNGTAINGALVCWAAGMHSGGVEIVGTVDRTRDGRLKTNEYLQLPDYPEVFVAGDAAAIAKNGTVQRRAINFAYYSGRTAGANLARRESQGTRLKPFRPVDLGWIIPLGGISLGHALGFLRIRGRIGLRMHYAMCGFRHFRWEEARDFYRTAFRLSRVPDSIAAEEDRS